MAAMASTRLLSLLASLLLLAACQAADDLVIARADRKVRSAPRVPSPRAHSPASALRGHGAHLPGNIFLLHSYPQ